VNAFTLRNERELEGSKMTKREDKSEVEGKGDAKKEVPADTSSERDGVEKTYEVHP